MLLRLFVAWITLARDLGMRPLLGLCHLGLGKLWRRDPGEHVAAAQLAEAIVLFQEMAMPFWSERAEAERKLLAQS